MNSGIYDVVFKSIQKKMAKYPYVNLSDKFIQDFISEKINKNLQDFGTQKQFVNYVSKLFENTIRSIIKANLDNETEYLDIINRYLELARLEIENSDKDLNLLTNLSGFLNSYQFESTPEKLVMIIKNNHYLFNTIKWVIEKNIELITVGKIRKIIHDENVCSFIEAYCMYHDIEIDKESDENNEKQAEDNLDEESYVFGNDGYYNEDSEKFLEYEIRRYKVLSFEEQKNLFVQYQSGDEKAKETLINTNLRLVLSIAKKHRNRGIELLDLFQVGTEGLITAVERYNLNMNTRFTTYATWWIRQAITRTICDHSRTIRIPVHMVEAQNKLNIAERSLTLELGREPTHEELARKLKISKNKLSEIYKSQKQTVSLNVLVGDDGDTEMGDLLPSEEMSIEESVTETMKCQDVMDLLHRANLTDREIDVLIRRFGIIDTHVMSLEEVGKIYNITRERIRQIEVKAINKLRKSPHTKAFASYMANPDEALEYLENYKNAYANAAKTNKKIIDIEDLKAGSTRKVRSNHTIYKFLSNYSKELVDELIASLSPASKELLRVRFGDDLENPVVSPDWNDEYHRRFNKLLHYMRKILENPKHVWRLKSIYNYFPKHDSLEVDLAIAMLTDEERALLKLRYGDDLHHPAYNVDWEYDLNNDVQLQRIIEKILKLLTLRELPKHSRLTKGVLGSNINNIYDYFAEWPRENVALAISLLSEEQLSILKIKFGENLDDYYTRPDWKSGQSLECRKILEYIKKQLRLPNFGHIYTVYELLPEYTKAEIDLAISKITDVEIKDKLNEFLQNGILTKKDKKQFNSIKHLLNKSLVKIKGVGFEKTIYELYSEYDAKVIDYVLASLSKEEVDLLSLKFGNDFHAAVLKKDLLARQQKKVDLLLDKIKCLLLDVKSKSNIEVIDIYSYFGEFPKKEVVNVLAQLSEEEINLLKLKFGDRLTLYSRKSNLTEEQSKKYRILINKIRRMLATPVKGKKKKFFEVFADYEIRDIKNVLKNLTESDINKLKCYYGEDLNEYPIADENIAKKVWVINAKIKRQLEKFKTERISIYTYFSEYTKEDIDLMLSKLDEHELSLLKKKFNDDFSCMIKRVNWSDEESKAYIALSSKMRRLLKNPNPKLKENKTGIKEEKKISIYDYFNGYTKEDIDSMLSKLTDVELVILRRKFGESLDNLVKKVNWNDGEEKQYVALSAKMRRLLKNPNSQIEHKDIKETSIEKISIYDYFCGYTRDEVNLMLSILTEAELNILYKKFGENLDNHVMRVNWTKEEHKKYRALSMKMRRLLNNSKPKLREKKTETKDEEKISIYQYFNEYTKEEIDLMLSKLTDSERIILYKKFGSKLDCLVKRVNWLDEESKAYIALSSKIRRLLKNQDSKINHKKDNHVEKNSTFKNFTQEEVDFMISKLTDLELVILHSKFGDDLDTLVKKLNWTEEESKMYIRLSAKMRSLLKNTTLNVSEKKTEIKEAEKISIYDYFSDYTNDEVNLMLSKLTEAELNILYKKFGENLDNLVKRVNWSNEEQKAYHTLYLKIQRIFKNRNKAPREIKSKDVKARVSIYDYFEKYSKEDIDLMLSTLNDSELKILRKKFGENLDCLVKRVNWSTEEQKAYHTLYLKIQRILKNQNKAPREIKSKDVKEPMSIYVYFKEYTQEEVNEMLSKLTDSELKILYKKFGNGLDNLIRRVNWVGSEQKEYAALHIKMVRSLKNPDTLVREKKSKEVVSQKITIYQYFKDYSVDDINVMLKTLTEPELKILRKKFGENLDCLVRRVEWAIGEEKRYTALMIKIKRRLASPNKKVRTTQQKNENLYEYFAEYSSDEINDVISSLTQEERDVLISYYGGDFTQKIDDMQECKGILMPVLDKMKNTLKTQKDKPISLYDYFAPYSREVIDKVLSKLSYGEKYLLMRKFDADFSCYQRSVDWSEEERKKYNSLVVKMKHKLNKAAESSVVKAEELLTLYDIFKGYSKEQIEWAISSFSPRDKDYIKSRYGGDLSKSYAKPDKLSYHLMELLHKINNKLHTLPASEQPKHVIERQRSDALKKAHELEVKKVANNIVFQQILTKLPRVEAVMLELKFGLYGKIYSTQEIASLFNKSETDILRIIKCALEDAKILVNPVSNEIIKLFNPVSDQEIKLTLEKKED